MEIQSIARLCRNGSVIHHRLLLCTLLDQYQRSCTEEKPLIPENLSRAIAEMQRPEHMRDGVQALMRLSHYSYQHLFRLMKQYYGTSPHEYIRRLRLEEAYRRLSATACSVETVAEEVGYESLSHFQMIFKQRYGETPSEVRRKRERICAV